MRHVNLHVSRFLFLSLLAMFLLGQPPSAQAHADGKVNIRAIHLEYHPQGLTAYYRLSFPLVAAAGQGNSTEGEVSRNAYPYVISRMESGRPFHYANPEKLAHGLGHAGALAASGHRLAVAGRVIAPEVIATAVHARGNVPPFSTLEQARAAVVQSTSLEAFQDVEIENVLIDIAALYRTVRSDDEIELQSTLDPTPLSDAPVKNVVVSHTEGRSTTYSLMGSLERAMTINPSVPTVARESIAAGTMHILQGADHLLFVACLALGAPSLRTVALRITAFTAGHAMSMGAAYFGLLPDSDWMSGAIELAIALSVLGSAVAVLARRMSSFQAPAIALAFGIVHGLGFAFGMRELVSTMGPNVIISFLSFSLGGEAVQIVFGAGIWVLSQRFHGAGMRRQTSAHAAIAMGLVLVAGFWVFERSVLLWEMIPASF